MSHGSISEQGAPASASIRNVAFITTSSDFGGAELLLKELATRLDPARFKAHVLSLTDLGRVGLEIRDAGVPTESLSLATEVRFSELPGAARTIAAYLRRNAIDLVHAQLYRANVLSCVAARLVRPRPRVVFSQHSLYAMTGAKAEWMARRTAPLADRIVAVSPEVAAYALSDMNARDRQVVTIPNGVDGERFRPGREEALRETFGFAPSDMVLGCVGRLSKEKGVDVLLRAMSELQRDQPGLRLLIVGDGPLRESLERLADELGLADRVVFAGARSDMPALYRTMDVFVLPSRREASPLALLEAMASGRAIVASRVGGVAGVAGEAAEIVPQDSVEALTRALRSLTTSAESLARFGDRARKRFEAVGSIETTVARHESLYAELLGAAD